MVAKHIPRSGKDSYSRQSLRRNCQLEHDYVNLDVTRSSYYRVSPRFEPVDADLDASTREDLGLAVRHRDVAPVDHDGPQGGAALPGARRRPKQKFLSKIFILISLEILKYTKSILNRY